MYDAFRSDTSDGFIGALADASVLFEAADDLEENRTDARLFAVLTKCYRCYLEQAPPNELDGLITDAQAILEERLFAFGGANSAVSLPYGQAESYLVQMLSYLDMWSEQLRNAMKWPDIKPPMQGLANAYRAIRELQEVPYFVGNVGRATQTHIMLPQIMGWFIKVQEISSKLAEVLADPAWRAASPDYEISFYEVVLREIQSAPDPKDWAAAGLETFRAAAQHKDPSLAKRIDESLLGGKEPSEVIFELIWQRLGHIDPASALYASMEKVPEEIHQALSDELYARLRWDPYSRKWAYLKEALKMALTFHYRTFLVGPAEASPIDVRFLFAKDSGILKGKGGLGQDATENSLEGFFYTSTRLSPWSPFIQRQVNSVFPGRSDLAFRFPGSHDFPIEVKAEPLNIDKDNVHAKYVSQGQAYGTLGVSFLMILDTTKKERKPLRLPAEWCYIDHVPAQGERRESLVIVLIFPANRYLPSDFTP